MHAAQISIGGRDYTTSFTVMESDRVDFLFGLDNMKRHKCNIDLALGVMRFEDGNQVAFVRDDEVRDNVGL